MTLLPCTARAEVAAEQPLLIIAEGPPSTAAPLPIGEAVAIESAAAVREMVTTRPEATPGGALSAQNRRRLRLPASLWIAGMVADQITTYKFSSEYGDLLHENNPLISSLDTHPALLVAAGTAFDVATGWFTYRVLGPRHPRLAQILFYGAAAYRSYLAVHNAQMMQRAREVRALSAATSPR
jgi:hypothetical protein